MTLLIPVRGIEKILIIIRQIGLDLWQKMKPIQFLIIMITLRQRQRGKTRKRWIAIQDEVTRPTHRDVDYTEMPIDGIFRVGTSLMLYPKDASLGASRERLSTAGAVFYIFDKFRSQRCGCFLCENMAKIGWPPKASSLRCFFAIFIRQLLKGGNKNGRGVERH